MVDCIHMSLRGSLGRSLRGKGKGDLPTLCLGVKAISYHQQSIFPIKCCSRPQTITSIRCNGHGTNDVYRGAATEVRRLDGLDGSLLDVDNTF